MNAKSCRACHLTLKRDENKWDRIKLHSKNSLAPDLGPTFRHFSDDRDEATKNTLVVFSSINTHRLIIPMIVIRMGLKDGI